MLAIANINVIMVFAAGLNNPATNIYSWIQHVLNAIEAVSWKRVGFERRADGSEDRNKPLHAMSNPNEIVDQMKAQFHELQVENSLLVLSRLYDDALSGKTSGTSSAPNFMSNSSRGLSSMLGNDPLAGIRGLSSSPMSMPPPPPQLSRHVGSREGSTSLAGHGFPDFAPAPERTPSMWRQQSLEYFGSCVETMMDSIFDQVISVKLTSSYVPNFELCLCEQQEIDVNGIFAIDYQAKRSLKKIGMPAFNSKNELVRI